MKSVKLQQVERAVLELYPSLYRLAYSYVKNPDDAMDIVQESAYKAILRAEEVKKQETIKSWLCRIVVNTSLDTLRKKRRETTGLENMPDAGKEDAYEDADLLRALEGLDERERTVVTLRYFEDMKLSEIVSVTGENLSTVKSIMYRSLKKLRVKLAEGESV